MDTYHKILLFLKRQPTYINWLIKGSILSLFALLLWYDIFKRESFEDIKNLFFVELRGRHIAWLVLTVLLLPLNWVAETLKWLPLIRHAEQVSFLKAFKAVLAGVTTSLFMPNRIGDFGGRLLFLKPKNAMKGVFSTFVGSWAQQIVLIAFGYLGFLYFLVTLWNVELFILQAIIFIGMVFVTLLFLIFLNLEIVVPIFKKIRFLYRFPRLTKSINIIRQYSRRELGVTLLWAFARYLVYMVQYYFMLRFFGIHVPILRGASCIATIYLLQTSIPLPPVMGLVARGEIALQIWGMFSANKVSILAATFTLWIINLIVPAFIGLIFILQSNILKSLGYEKSS